MSSGPNIPAVRREILLHAVLGYGRGSQRRPPFGPGSVPAVRKIGAVSWSVTPSESM